MLLDMRQSAPTIFPAVCLLMISNRVSVILGVSLIAGLALFGYQVRQAVKRGREFDRFLTVRGLSEREVKATLGIWQLRFSVVAEELVELKKLMENDREIVTDYLAEQGIKPEEISHGLPIVNDRLDERIHSGKSSLQRYRGVITLVVRTANVDVLKKAVQGADALLTKGVTLAGNEYDSRTQFTFNGVNAIKPEMIKEATAGARAAAEKFAQDSGSKVGRIRKASQGALEIQDRDVATPEMKTLRVVTTVEFFLE
jgi:uncharacterized protein